MEATGLVGNQNDSSSENLKQRFLKAAYELQAIGARAGYRILPTANKNLPYFSAVDCVKQLQAVSVLEKSCSIYGAVIANGESIRNPNSVVWSAFGQYNLRPPSNFFDKMKSEDVIEVYTAEGLHLFSNLRFFGKFRPLTDPYPAH